MTDLTATAAPCGCACDAVPEEELNARLEEVIREYRDKPGGLIPALQTAQALFGYLPEPVIRKIADGFGKPVSEVTGVVTFCLGTACYVRGGKAIAEALQREFNVSEGETTPDRRFTYETVRCLGACGLGPVVVIDEDVHGRMKPSKLKDVLSQYT